MEENIDLFEKLNNILQKNGLTLNKAKNCAIKNQYDKKLFLGDDFYVLWKKPFNNEKNGSSEEILFRSKTLEPIIKWVSEFIPMEESYNG